MPRNKAPGLDALTPEGLRKQWRRGVRQGCPLAPLLFALATIPLISMLQKATDQQRLKAVQLQTGVSVVTSLYADNTVIFPQVDQDSFHQLQRILDTYCTASGGQLNLNNLEFVLLGKSSALPDWLRNCGAKYISPSDQLRLYTFSPTAVQIPVDVTLFQFLRCIAKGDQAMSRSWWRLLTNARIRTTLQVLRYRPLLPNLLPSTVPSLVLQQILSKFQSLSTFPIYHPSWWVSSATPSCTDTGAVAKFYYSCLPDLSEQMEAYICKVWSIPRDLIDWSHWFNTIFRQPYHRCESLWLWRMAYGAFFTGTRLQRMRLPNAECAFCHEDPESVRHLFLSCPRWSDTWQRIYNMFPPLWQIRLENLFHFFVLAPQAPDTFAMAVFMVQLWRHFWHLRCSLLYDNSLIRPSVIEALVGAVDHLVTRAQQHSSHLRFWTTTIATITVHLPPSLRIRYHQPPLLLT
ncbi:hypothetical protein R1sor_007179 [Riccia sorocarpa]|uniref:Reverse transcriptase zinc-binding domain-containing protein n=1 Tax=Riccia sorocarpa TaxID=122646 RepID=A0ABD3HPN9_9MARC